MPDPVVLRLVRPYQSVEEYLNAEACWIEPKRMLLIDAEPLANETVVRFAVSISVGEPLIRAEGSVIGYQKPSADAPGGVLVRFRRFGESTKAFVDRAQQARARQRSSTLDAGGAEPPVAEPPAVHAADPAPAMGPAIRSTAPQPGPRQREAKSVDAPANRDELLERLRQRGRRQRRTTA